MRPLPNCRIPKFITSNGKVLALTKNSLISNDVSNQGWCCLENTLILVSIKTQNSSQRTSSYISILRFAACNLYYILKFMIYVRQFVVPPFEKFLISQSGRNNFALYMTLWAVRSIPRCHISPSSSQYDFEKNLFC